MTDIPKQLPSKVERHLNYVVDTRPLCQGTPFLLTDAAHPRLVLKHGSHFLILEESAAIPACNNLGYGYYRYDTRHISQWEMFLDDAPMSLLSSSIAEGFAGSFLYTNAQTGSIPQQKITVHREVVLSDLLWERLTIENFHNEHISCRLKLSFQSDFADIFEVRGLNRPHRGTRMIPTIGKGGQAVFLAYRGEDGNLLETVIEFIGIKPDDIHEGDVTFNLELPVRGIQQFEIAVSTVWEGSTLKIDDSDSGYSAARKLVDTRYNSWLNHGTSVTTNNEFFDHLLERCFRDIYILRQPTPKGIGLAAGVPWYSAVFGRDSAITAAQILPFLPDVSRECIQVLAAYQGQITNPFRDEQPGRIMHELRLGELARTQEVPHSPYYGSVDATQLWLSLICNYINWTGDLELGHQLWDNIRLALKWLDDTAYGGYIFYKRQSEKGLDNQGWKDSGDSVMHTNGELAVPPIAICEAQAYLFAAKKELAYIAEVLGHPAIAKRLLIEAAKLKTQFQKDFWMPEEDFLAMAIDGNGKQVKVLSSNPGHCLATGILDDDKAQAIANRLMSNELHSGWGIRTLSGNTSAYNPVSYHNGSVWPHDNAMIAEGLVKMGRVADAQKLMKSMFDVACHEPEFRLPELFCGFERNESYRAINYPVSCCPQAWAVGSMLQMLKACMNFEPDACNQKLKIVEPCLPEWLGRVTIRGLRIGGAMVDLSFNTQDGSTSCQILKKSGQVRIIIEN